MVHRNRRFSILGREIGPSHRPYVIAEISANHNGSLQKAFDTIEMASKCGIDAVKIQSYTADTMTIDCHKEEFSIKEGLWKGYNLYQLYKWAETPFEWHEQLFNFARKKQITLFSTPFDETAVDLLENLNVPAYKIASFELLDLPLIRYVGSTKKPIIMSTGMASAAEVSEAVEVAYEAGCPALALLHCVSSYPTPIDQANIRRVELLAREYDTLVGLSDHTIGDLAATLAVGLGASIVEKHFTLSRSDPGPDSAFSIEPQELKLLVEKVRDAWLALGTGTHNDSDIESASLKYRRSIYLVKDLPEGHRIGPEDIRRIRPGYGLSPKYFDEVVGLKLLKPVSAGTPLSWDLLEK